MKIKNFAREPATHQEKFREGAGSPHGKILNMNDRRACPLVGLPVQFRKENI